MNIVLITLRHKPSKREAMVALVGELGILTQIAQEFGLDIIGGSRHRTAERVQDGANWVMLEVTLNNKDQLIALPLIDTFNPQTVEEHEGFLNYLANGPQS